MISRIYLLNLLALVFLSAVFYADNAFAISLDVGARIFARQAIGLSNPHSMNFGDVQFAPTHSAVLSLGTDGNVAVSGTGIEIGGTTAAGSVDISSDGVSVIEISCVPSGTLGGPGGRVLDIENVEVSTTPVVFGSGNKCNGVGNSSINTTGGSLTLYIGAEANIASNSFINGVYDTSLSGGSPITVDIVYQ